MATVRLERTVRTAGSPATSAESTRLQAVQVSRPTLVTTAQGEIVARTGEWMVTGADGKVLVMSDHAFRLQALRQQLAEMIVRAQHREKRSVRTG